KSAVMASLSPTLADLGVLEDALCSPEFPDYSFINVGSTFPSVVRTASRPVRFVVPGDGVHSGVGDLYFETHILNGESNYWTQQDRLVSCAAASMRQVYLAGPQSHGR